LSTIIFVVVIAVVLLMNMADIKGEKKSDKGLEAR
jgi:hypothetical protein